MPDPDHGLFVGQSPRNLMASPPSRPHPLNLVTTSPSVGRREVSGHPLALQSLPGISQESTFNSSVLSSPVFNGNTSVNSANVDWSSPWRSGQVSSVMLNPGSRSNVLSTPEVPRHHPQQIRQHQQDSGKRGRPRADEIRELIQEGSSSPSEIKCRTCHRVFPREKSLQVRSLRPQSHFFDTQLSLFLRLSSLKIAICYVVMVI